MPINYKELTHWANVDFSDTHDSVMDSVVDNPQWIMSGRNSYGSNFCVLPSTGLVHIEKFRLLAETLIDHHIRVSKFIVRKFIANEPSIIHIDKSKINSFQIEPVELTLNIPIRISNNTLTRWYDFSADEKLSQVDLSLNPMSTP